jgi:hypothetical protein
VAKISDLLLVACLGAIVGALVILGLTPKAPRNYPTPRQVCSYLAIRFDHSEESGSSWDPTRKAYRSRNCPVIMAHALEGESP